MIEQTSQRLTEQKRRESRLIACTEVARLERFELQISGLIRRFVRGADLTLGSIADVKTTMALPNPTGRNLSRRAAAPSVSHVWQPRALPTAAQPHPCGN
jgi:hypothetical protein